jgi:DNA topoisomerase-1
LPKNLVIVESPAKAKTINRYLGNDFTVLASYGHIRDLPAKDGSVLPNENFSMIWQVDSRSEKQLKDIQTALKGVSTLYLATDPDREGEAISWHVQEVLNERGALKNKDIHRIVFHEITQTAVQQALKNPRQVNSDLVQAYLARRALDYLVGFNLSPVLWRKLPGSRSAGRVQSVALRMIVEREQEIEAFKNQEYWSVEGLFATPKQQTFTARLTHYDSKKLEKLAIGSEDEAKKIVDWLRNQAFYVADIEKKQTKRHPAAPFITSTLQQEAARKLGFTASRTMQVAQKLYEGVDIGGETTGLITYMRTDGVTLSNDAIQATRAYLEKAYGKDYLPTSPRVYKSKAKNAQEAHEAIRPTDIQKKPQDVAKYLDDSQLKLYELIWKRTVACQMESALFDQVAVDVQSQDKTATLRATGSTQVFDGFLRVYQEGTDDDDLKDKETLLPLMNVQDVLDTKEITPNQHFTQPPPRYTEASLVKKLEELGIGRPSTYASLIQVLQDRDYVRLEKKQFIPEDRGRLVISFLSHFFKKYVEYDFTANLEEQLDEISAGHLPWQKVLEVFWKDFHENVDSMSPVRITEVIEKLEEDLGNYLFHGAPKGARNCPQCQEGQLSLKLGKFGAFLGCSNYPTCKYTRPISTSEADAQERTSVEPVILGQDPISGATITVRVGPYGPYLQWDGEEPPIVPVVEEPKKGKKKKAPAAPKPKRVSLAPGMEPGAITLEQAMMLKELPKSIGVHPETGQEMKLGLGRFGPYVKHGDLFASIPKTESFFDITVERAAELVTQKQNKPAKPKKKVPAKKVASKKAPSKKA